MFSIPATADALTVTVCPLFMITCELLVGTVPVFQVLPEFQLPELTDVTWAVEKIETMIPRKRK
jgi:hypothetical protein